MTEGELRKGGKTGWKEGKKFQGTDQKREIQAAQKMVE
jgi:hypothetical protein